MTTNLVFDQNIANWVASTLIISNAYRIAKTSNRKEWFTWKSGIVAPVYCNTRQVSSHPFARQAAMSGLHAAIDARFSDVQGIIGMATAGIGWANTLAHLINLPSGYVRAVEKSHGLGGLIEYYQPEARRVVLVDDLVASGASLSKAIQAAESSGLEVIGILSIVNWNFPQMKEALFGRDIVSLCSYNEILQQLKIDDEAKEDLRNFYQSPSTHEWNSCLFGGNTKVIAA